MAPLNWGQVKTALSGSADDKDFADSVRFLAGESMYSLNNVYIEGSSILLLRTGMTRSKIRRGSGGSVLLFFVICLLTQLVVCCHKT